MKVSRIFNYLVIKLYYSNFCGFLTNKDCTLKEKIVCISYYMVYNLIQQSEKFFNPWYWYYSLIPTVELKLGWRLLRHSSSPTLTKLLFATHEHSHDNRWSYATIIAPQKSTIAAQLRQAHVRLMEVKKLF